MIKAAIFATDLMSELDISHFRKLTSVSRETLEQFKTYERLILEWQKALNLVSRASLSELWMRHFFDSAQLWSLIPPHGRIVDIGSGAGFPGLVLSIMGRRSITLVESDERKAAFLFEAARELGADAEIVCRRIESWSPSESPSCIMARAVADLSKLLALTDRLIEDHTICVFPKGRTVAAELTEAQKTWKMNSALYPSLSDPTGSIVRLTEVQRATI